MGERTLLKLKQGKDEIWLYLHWYNPADCQEAFEETLKNTRNNIRELAKFVTYFILDHGERASIYVVPRNELTYGESKIITIELETE